MNPEVTFATLFTAHRAILGAFDAGTSGMNREELIAELGAWGMETRCITDAVSDEVLRSMVASFRRCVFVKRINCIIWSLTQQLLAERQKNSRRSRRPHAERNAAIVAARTAGASWGTLARKFDETEATLKGVVRRAKKQAKSGNPLITIEGSGTETL
jgi:hypothetical protein